MLYLKWLGKEFEMFFGEVDQIKKIAQAGETSIFVVPRDVEVKMPGALVLQPEEKATISIEQAREMIRTLQTRQLSDTFVIIRPADALSLEAANALLKSLEEPQSKVHFILITDEPSRLLPTILSRAALFFLRPDSGAVRQINADEKMMSLAKRLIAAKPKELVSLAEEISRKKTNVRQYVLEVLGVAIEILYKTYLINQKSVFLDKIPKFLAAYDAIYRNGHIKLHLVVDLV